MQNPAGKSALGLDANVAAGLAYIPCISLIMAIIILVTDKVNKLARFHAFQSLLLLGVLFVGYIVVIVLGVVAGIAESGILLGLISLLYFAILLGWLAAVVFACIKAFTGQIFKLPIIGEMADKWSN